MGQILPSHCPDAFVMPNTAIAPLHSPIPLILQHRGTAAPDLGAHPARCRTDSSIQPCVGGCYGAALGNARSLCPAPSLPLPKQMLHYDTHRKPCCSRHCRGITAHIVQADAAPVYKANAPGSGLFTICLPYYLPTLL